MRLSCCDNSILLRFNQCNVASTQHMCNKFFTSIHRMCAGDWCTHFSYTVLQTQHPWHTVPKIRQCLGENPLYSLVLQNISGNVNWIYSEQIPNITGYPRNTNGFSAQCMGEKTMALFGRCVDYPLRCLADLVIQWAFLHPIFMIQCRYPRLKISKNDFC
jgi:hypothetical protein